MILWSLRYAQRTLPGLMIFAGNLDGAAQGDGNDTVEFYEFKDDKFIFIKSMPYGHQDNTQ
jgi:hypothetical protein